MEFDILISGAGPAGLCLAQALADSGLNIGLVEQQPLTALREAPFDSRGRNGDYRPAPRL